MRNIFSCEIMYLWPLNAPADGVGGLTTKSVVIQYNRFSNLRSVLHGGGRRPHNRTRGRTRVDPGPGENGPVEVNMRQPVRRKSSPRFSGSSDCVVRRLRLFKSLTQRDLGALCGISQGAISAIELGRFSPQPELRHRLGLALGVSEAALFGSAPAEVSDDSDRG